jgi:starvation-inducible DNA-binding protein
MRESDPKVKARTRLGIRLQAFRPRRSAYSKILMGSGGAEPISDRCAHEPIQPEGHMADKTAALQTPTDLNRNDTRSVADALNSALADCYALYIKTKNFHWHVSGPHFRDYHLMLDDQATQILGVTDLIAERVRKTGNTTLRSIGDIARRQTLSDNDAEFVSAADMLAELRDDNLKLVESFRAVKQAAEDANDNATSGVVDEWTDQAEERAWFLFEASRKG